MKNLVIYGVDESADENGKEREKEGTEFSKRLFDELNVNDVKVDGIIRLGKRNQREGNQGIVKQRPMLVKLQEAREKFELLKRGNKLKQSHNVRLRKIVIAPDLTKMERDKDKKLREELKEKKLAGENGWFIKKGKLQRNF